MTLIGFGQIAWVSCPSLALGHTDKSTAGVAQGLNHRMLRILDEVSPSPCLGWRGLILVLPKWMIFINSEKKTKVGVAIPIHEDLLTQLLELPSPDDNDAPIFPSLHGKAGGGKVG